MRLHVTSIHVDAAMALWASTSATNPSCYFHVVFPIIISGHRLLPPGVLLTAGLLRDVYRLFACHTRSFIRYANAIHSCILKYKLQRTSVACFRGSAFGVCIHPLTASIQDTFMCAKSTILSDTQELVCQSRAAVTWLLFGVPSYSAVRSIFQRPVNELSVPLYVKAMTLFFSCSGGSLLPLPDYRREVETSLLYSRSAIVLYLQAI